MSHVAPALPPALSCGVFSRLSEDSRQCEDDVKSEIAIAHYFAFRLSPDRFHV